MSMHSPFNSLGRSRFESHFHLLEWRAFPRPSAMDQVNVWLAKPTQAGLRGVNARRRVHRMMFSNEPCSVWRVPLELDHAKPSCRRCYSASSSVLTSVYEWLSAIELSSRPATPKIQAIINSSFHRHRYTTDPNFPAVYLEEKVQRLPESLSTSCLGALKIMRANQNPDGIDSTAINTKSQDFTTPLTLYHVNGSSSLTNIEGEPFSPAELAAIFALSKAQATVQAAMNSNHSGDVTSYEFAPFLKPFGYPVTYGTRDPKLTPGAEEAESGDESDGEYPPSSWNRKDDCRRRRPITSSRMKSGKDANEDIAAWEGGFTTPSRPSNSTRSSLSSVRGFPPTIKEDGEDSEDEAEEDELTNDDISADYDMEPDMNDAESEYTGRTSPEPIAAPYTRRWTQSTKSCLRYSASRRESPSVRVAPYDTRASRSPPSPKIDRDRRSSVRSPTKRGRRSRPKPDFPKAPTRRPGIAEGSFHIPPLPSPIEPLAEERAKDLQNMFDKVILALSMVNRPCRKDELVWMIEKIIPEHRNPGWRGWEVRMLC